MPDKPKSQSQPDLDAWILGSGIASLSAAVHLLRDANLPPHRIHILESRTISGGGSISSGDPVNGYDYRAGCMPGFNDVCMEDLLSLVPMGNGSGRTIKEEIKDFNSKERIEDRANTRLLVRGSKGLERVDGRRGGLGMKERMDIMMLMTKTERGLGRMRIEEYFGKGFFKTTFWIVWSTTSGFRECHSVAEFRRSLHRFYNDFDELNHPRVLDRTRFNHYESIVVPITHFLQHEGVDFRFHSRVTDIITDPADDHRRVSTIRYVENCTEKTIAVRQNDIVIVSLGSIMSGSSSGTNTEPPSLELMGEENGLDENWLLWLELATKDAKFGNAYNFCTRMNESQLESFTVTLRTPAFFNAFIELTGDEPGTGALVTLKDSPWLFTLSIPHQPLFPNQPEHIQVFWGYASYPDRTGDYIKKPMLSCSGEEIMIELLHHLNFPVPDILSDSITIPCVMPRMAATFLPRDTTDRPKVIPEHMMNMALIGRFVNIPDETVTMDYTVRGAQMAVYNLMGLDKETRKSRKSSSLSFFGL
ncbi:hypothetical protein ASPWEDRAFT_26485 [Aspergillus wentii DTO 134E9]|uniref:Oleate hydratase n=1 Tax=Aspergillus wentii DTO 134E9 TaxID=1073089 RepID=A0A1L9RQH4_ASPWE|nr:uncharacterized protein ASPWEDRAFT_26485 [Aspergillus wentii DTO 134E9]OJJ37068.1 hypothetical protein ASPWEDRAFT_26485 [Aspergillus wentii DTO 134E9]